MDRSFKTQVVNNEFAAQLTNDIAALVKTKYKVGPWWGQMVTVGYERIKGLRVAPYYGCQIVRPRRHGVELAEIDDPTFFGAYVEGGYFFTGESRGYKAGKFDRVKVLKPFGKGGY